MHESERREGENFDDFIKETPISISDGLDWTPEGEGEEKSRKNMEKKHSEMAANFRFLQAPSCAHNYNGKESESHLFL